MEMRKRKVLLVKVGRYLSSKQLYESIGHVGDGEMAGSRLPAHTWLIDY